MVGYPMVKKFEDTYNRMGKLEWWGYPMVIKN